MTQSVSKNAASIAWASRRAVYARIRAPLLIAILLALCGCGSSTPLGTADAPRSDVAPTPANPTALRRYLRAWEASWWRRSRDLARGGEDDPAFSATPDGTWNRAQRIYGEAASAYRREERRLMAIAAPSAMRSASEAYIDAVRRQATRLQDVSDAYAGDDADALNRTLMALQRSQLEFDDDGARWERAVIAACKASDVEVPKIVRREYVSNGQRTS